MSIPKIIHMTFKERKIPNNTQKKWKNLNPDYQFTFSSDEDCIAFLREKFSEDYANIFKKIKLGPHKADFWRLCKLYIEGGVYVDIDLVPLASLNFILKNNTFVSCLSAFGQSSINNKYSSIFQAFLACTRRSPIIKLCIDSFIYNLNKMNLYSKNCNFLGPTFDMYNVLVKITKRLDLYPNIVYNIKLNDNLSEKIYLYREVNLIPNKPNNQGYFVIDNNSKQIILKSRSDSYKNWLRENNYEYHN